MFITLADNAFIQLKIVAVVGWASDLNTLVSEFVDLVSLGAVSSDTSALGQGPSPSASPRLAEPV